MPTTGSDLPMSDITGSYTQYAAEFASSASNTAITSSIAETRTPTTEEPINGAIIAAMAVGTSTFYKISKSESPFQEAAVNLRFTLGQFALLSF